MTPDDARRFHEETLVIDSQQPRVTSGLLYTESMHEAMKELVARGPFEGRDPQAAAGHDGQ